MGNIWGVLLQGITVSFTAILLLVIKRVMADKLSPRWQYGVWSVLALRILLPVSMKRNIFGPLPFWMENWKSMVESHLSSAYSAVYEPISVRFVLPYFEAAPLSVTDWMLVLYAVGVVLCALRYLISYLRLRHLLRQGEPVPANTEERIRQVCEKYGLKACRAVAVHGLPSAFISGIFRPVLAVPAGVEVDEKILLHELLHLKYRDSLQSVFWCGLRCLHWFNPLMHYVFDRIDNDMESLCDQRVLERLKGEERREYGAILLDMANDRYPRVPGTSSISNGGRNIARRIEAIVRFKKYPRGMALVSVCIILVMLSPVLVGTAADYSGYYHPMTAGELNNAMVMARLNRCSTKAGALDTYAKSLMFENGVYRAMVSPLEEHEELKAQMQRTESGSGAYYLDSGWELEYVQQSVLYEIYNLRRLDDGDYEAALGLYVYRFPDKSGEGYLKNEDGKEIYNGAVLITVRLWYDGGWMVEESGERQILEHSGALQTKVEPLRTLTAQGKTGTVTIENVIEYSISQTVQQTDSIFGWMNTRLGAPDVEAEFDGGLAWNMYTYDMNTKNVEEAPKGMDMVGVYVALPSAPGEVISFGDTFEDFVYDYTSSHYVTEGSVSGKYNGYGTYKHIGYSWDGLLNGGGATQFYGGGDEPASLPEEYQAAIYWAGKLVETVTLREVVDE